MCGIIGYIGDQKAAPILISGLKRMEYRGYDSAGVALLEDDSVEVIKRAGKVTKLTGAIGERDLASTSGIGHTRWATHGIPSEINAHPHTAGNISMVHNGIIENYLQIKESLSAKGVEFKSQTDSEALVHLINHNFQETKNLLEAVRRSLVRVEGTFGVAIISSDEPGKIIAARRGSPLLLGIGDGEMYVASDATAILGHTNKVVYLDDDQLAVCEVDSYKVSDLENQAQELKVHTLKMELAALEKSGYDHFLLKEINEQPKTVADILRGRLDFENGTSHLGGLNVHDAFLRKQQRFLTIGCGTAYFAGLLGKYMLERLTGIPVDVEFGSEFRYRDPAVTPNTLGLIMSQSGETADTLASLRELKRRGIPTLGLVNVVGSSVAREVDGGVYLHAGPEVSVASTKAFTAQVVAQLLVGLQIARLRGLSLREGREIIKALNELGGAIDIALKQAPLIKKLSVKYAKFNHVMYLGRDALYPVALEGALKLKEVSYIHAEAYPAGEMKHGAIALVTPQQLVVFLAPSNDMYAKSRSNLAEVRARSGTVLAIATEGNQELKSFAEDVIYIPKVSPWIEPLVANIPLQLFAYYMAVERETDVDQPRNLAKSVTVE